MDGIRRNADRPGQAVLVVVLLGDAGQQAANADAMLIALFQEADETSLIVRARTWSDDLRILYDSLTEVLQGSEDVPSAQSGAATDGPDFDEPIPLRSRRR